MDNLPKAMRSSIIKNKSSFFKNGFMVLIKLLK
jgi:hypothetical protein